MQATLEYIKAMKVVYPAVEWRITMTGKVQEDKQGEDEKEEEEEEEDGRNKASHVSASFMVIMSVLFYVQNYRD